MTATKKASPPGLTSLIDNDSPCPPTFNKGLKAGESHKSVKLAVVPGKSRLKMYSRTCSNRGRASNYLTIPA